MAIKGSYKDITRQKFGKLTVIKHLNNNKGVASFLCKCECGKEVSVRGSYLRFGKTKSCGCLSKINMIGKKYGKLTVIEQHGSEIHGKSAQPVYLCQCKCGNKIKVLGRNIRSGNTKSCGCLNHRSQTIDITGKVFGYLKVKELFGNNKYQNPMWKCLCLRCNEEKVIAGGHLKSGATRSCGCLVRGPTFKKYKHKTNIYRSGFELIIAMVLEHRNIKFQFEPKCFRLNLNNKSIRYTPDFYLPDYDLWLETKGYAWNNSIDKYNKFKEKHKSMLITQVEIIKILDSSLSNFYKKWKEKNHNKQYVKNIVCKNAHKLEIN